MCRNQSLFNSRCIHTAAMKARVNDLRPCCAIDVHNCWTFLFHYLTNFAIREEPATKCEHEYFKNWNTRTEISRGEIQLYRSPHIAEELLEVRWECTAATPASMLKNVGESLSKKNWHLARVRLLRYRFCTYLVNICFAAFSEIYNIIEKYMIFSELPKNSYSKFDWLQKLV